MILVWVFAAPPFISGPLQGSGLLGVWPQALGSRHVASYMAGRPTLVVVQVPER
jgi:hypothetical protein